MGSRHQRTPNTRAVAIPVEIAAPGPNRKWAIRRIAPDIASARVARPTSAARLAKKRISCLRPWRNCSRWYAVGAIRNADESAVSSRTEK